MPIPKKTLTIERPKNTVVIAYGKNKHLYAVHQRVVYRNDNGRHIPINGPTIGHIIDGIYVPVNAAAPVNVSVSPVDSKDWASVVQRDNVFKIIQSELFTIYSHEDLLHRHPPGLRPGY